MSRYAQIHEAAIKDRRFGDAAFRTYSFLLTYMRNGRSFPKARTIAQEMGLARSTVSGHLNAAAKLGYLIIEFRFRSDGGRASNHYRVPDDLKVAATAKLAVDGCSGDNGSPIRFSDSPPVSPDPTAPVSPDPTAPVSPDPTAKNRAKEQNLPCGEGARTREEEVLRSRSVGRQAELLLPLNGTKAPLAAPSTLDPFEAYRPPLELVSLARDLGIGDIDEVLDDWRDWHRKESKPFPAKPYFSFRRWIRKERHFARNRGSPRPSGSALLKVVLEEAKIDD
jgi:Helix-turn-helix domain